MIRTYMEKLGIDPQTAGEDVRRAFRNLKQVGRVLKSGEEMGEEIRSQQETQTEPNNEQSPPHDPRIFLRSFAYTMSMVDDPEKDKLTLDFTPRLLSTGNALASLGFHKVATKKASPQWIEKRAEVEEKIAEHFKHKKETAQQLQIKEKERFEQQIEVEDQAALMKLREELQN